MTLVELVTSLAIFSVLVVAIGSAIVTSTRAMEAATAIDASSGSEVAAQVAADLQTALSFSERTAAAATFTVPDRNGDGTPEILRYAWSGTAGDPLTYSYNEGSAVTIADDLYAFDLSYLLRTMTPASGGEEEDPNVESDEMVLIYHDDAPRGSFKWQSLRLGDLAAQYFSPTLPTNITSWKITRVSVRLLGAPASGANILVQIRPATAAQKPSSQVVEQVSIPASSLVWSWQWVDVSFSALAELNPNTAHCVVVTSDLDAYSGNIQYESRGNPMTPNTHWMTSADGGSSWSNPEDKNDMRFYVYGTVTTNGDPQWP